MDDDTVIDEHAPLFSIAAAAELAGMHPQTLRQYDRLGLVSPGRTAGNTRRYSLRNVAHLREVQKLSSQGVSLPGIARILQLEDEANELRKRVRALETRLADELLARQRGRVFATSQSGDVVLMRLGARTQPRSEIVRWRDAHGGRNGTAL